MLVIRLSVAMLRVDLSAQPSPFVFDKVALLPAYYQQPPFVVARSGSSGSNNSGATDRPRYLPASSATSTAASSALQLPNSQ
jgi:hypothetical protein